MIILHRKFPPGGVVGQFLRKCSSKDNDVEWANIPSGSSLPDGGTTGQALRKASNADQDVSWQNDPDPFPTGGSNGQILAKTASGQQWEDRYFIQTMFSDWSSINLTLNTLIDAPGFPEKVGRTSLNEYAGYVCQRAYNNSLALILKLQVNGDYLVTPVSVMYISSTSYKVSFLKENSIRYIEVNRSQVKLQ